MSVIYLVGFQSEPGRPGSFAPVGVFDDLKLANAACIDRRYMVVYLKLNQPLSQDTIDPDTLVCRPNCSVPDPDLVARQAAALQSCADQRCPDCGGEK